MREPDKSQTCCLPSGSAAWSKGQEVWIDELRGRHRVLWGVGTRRNAGMGWGLSWALSPSQLLVGKCGKEGEFKQRVPFSKERHEVGECRVFRELKE